MKWICWECGHENNYSLIKAVQDKCPQCGAQLKVKQVPLANASSLAGLLIMFGGILWGHDNLVDTYLSFESFAALAVIYALAVWVVMSLLGLAFYNRAAVAHREEGRL